MKQHFIQLFDWHRWDVVLVYCAIALLFLYGILRPRKRSEWRSAGIAAGWVIALYAEMYGLPLTLYLLSPMFGSHLAPTEFQRGHLWAPLLGLEDSVYWQLVFVVIGQAMIALGALISIVGWRQLWKQREDLITTGLYRYIRHPQYTGFFLFIIGSLVNWPTLITLVMAPLLLWRYCRLARQEESDMLDKLGEQYRQYMESTERFIPNFTRRRS